MNETLSPQILLVEDSAVVRRALNNALRNGGYKVGTVTTASDAIQAVFAQLPDLMILDLSLDTGSFDTFRDGFALLNWLRRMLPNANFPVIINTGDSSPLVDERARAAGVFAVVRKDDRSTDILHVVRQALEQASSVTA